MKVMNEDEQIKHMNKVFDYIDTLNNIVKSSIDINSQIHFSTLMSKLSTADQEKCRRARLYFYDSEVMFLSNYKEVESLSSSFKCGYRVISDFVIQRVQ